MDYPPAYGNPSSSSSLSWLTGSSNILTRIMGFSVFASLFQGLPGNTNGQVTPAGGSYLWDSARLFLLGLIIETGRRFCQWLIERVRFQYSIKAQFSEGDPAYDWLILFLTEAQVWKSSRDFRVSATSSLRKWGVKPNAQSPSGSSSSLAFHLPLLGDKAESDEPEKNGKEKDPHAEYVPTFEAPQLFRWKGYWVEIKRQNGKAMSFNPMMGAQPSAVMYLTIYTNNMSVLSSFVEEARLGYVKNSRPHVIVHTADQPNFGPAFAWSNAKSKARRPLSSIILQEGVISSLVSDAREFLETEEWYVKAGIPHRRGYLLYGPPGTGKTSTIYAIAGELGLEIFSLSLASNFVDDSFLQRAVAAVPKTAIFLIEDIDCAFPTPRSDDASSADYDANNNYDGQGPGGVYSMPMNMVGGMYPGGVMGPGGGMGGGKRSLVTLSGLLNVLDGVGSEEGKIFFATTNYIDHLDAALLRPGRIDKKIQYKLATQAQAEALYVRFYPQEVVALETETLAAPNTSSDPEKPTPVPTVQSLATLFSTSVPAHQFSTAELQGYLLAHKKTPALAASGASGWVTTELAERQAKKDREEERRAKAVERREEREARALRGGLARIGVQTPGVGGGFVGGPSGEVRPMAPGGGPGFFGGMPPNTVGMPVGPSPAPPSLDAPGPMPEVRIGSPAPKKPLVNGVSEVSNDVVVNGH